MTVSKKQTLIETRVAPLRMSSLLSVVSVSRENTRAMRELTALQNASMCCMGDRWVNQMRGKPLTFRSISRHGTSIVSSMALTVLTNFSMALRMLWFENSWSSCRAIRRRQFLRELRERERNLEVRTLIKKVKWWFHADKRVEFKNDSRNFRGAGRNRGRECISARSIPISTAENRCCDVLSDLPRPAATHKPRDRYLIAFNLVFCCCSSSNILPIVSFQADELFSVRFFCFCSARFLWYSSAAEWTVASRRDTIWIGGHQP